MSGEDYDKVRDDQKLDQEFARMADMLPPVWWRMYKNLQTAGFTKFEAMDLLKMFISRP